MDSDDGSAGWEAGYECGYEEATVKQKARGVLMRELLMQAEMLNKGQVYFCLCKEDFDKLLLLIDGKEEELK